MHSPPPHAQTTSGPATRFKGNQFCAVSWSGDIDPAFAAKLNALTHGWQVHTGQGCMVASQRADHFARSGDVAIAIGTPFVVDRTSGRALNADALVKRPSAFADIAPPHRAVWLDGDRIHAQTDLFGLGQLFYARKAGVSAVASSATLLAGLLDCGPDPEGLIAFALFGCYPDDMTGFSDVRKVAPGARIDLSYGNMASQLEPAPAGSGEPIPAIFKRAVETLSGAFPEAHLELSGGLDSRLILAALDPAVRARHPAMTIGYPGSVDFTIASSIARSESLTHHRIDLNDMAALLEGDGLAPLLDDAVLAYDHGGNPIDKVPLIYAGREIDTAARFAGVNGEIMRGFFYPGQPLDAAPDAALAARLIQARMVVNDRVDPRLFEPRAYQELKASAESRMVARILGFSGNWSAKLDHLYLAERMQRWAGNAMANRLTDRVGLYPFFEPDFVAAAMALPASQKSNSRAAYAMIAELDRALAAIPLDSGTVPADVSASAMRRHYSEVKSLVLKIYGRARLRLSGGARPTLGSGLVGQQWHRQRLFERLPFDALDRTGLFDPAMLDRIRTGAWLPDRPTLGFVLIAASMTGRPT